MKAKKGFTLIELLAVIVILAIIALIATPAIINVIENARKKAFEDTTYGVMEGLRLDYVERTANGTSSKVVEFNFPKSGLKLSGVSPAGGKAKIDENGKISFALFDKDKRWCAKKDANNEKVTMSDYSDANCKIDGTSGGGNASIPNSFATDSWDTIANAVKAGNTSKYKVGDEKDVTLTGEYAGTYKVRISNTSTPAECNGADFSQTACGFVVEFKDIITVAPMNLDNSTNKGGWPATLLYNKVNTSIYNTLPEELKKVIMDTKVVSSHGNVDLNNFISLDKIYLLSFKEIWGKEGMIDYDTSNYYTRQLDYYKFIGVTTNNYSGAIKKYKGSKNFMWWLRSTKFNSDNGFIIVRPSGGETITGVTTTNGVSPAFKIG